MQNKLTLIIKLLPILFPLGLIILITIDSVIHDYDPMNGEQGLGTIGAIFSSFVLGAIVSLAIVLALKIKKKYFK